MREHLKKVKIKSKKVVVDCVVKLCFFTTLIFGVSSKGRKYTN